MGLAPGKYVPTWINLLYQTRDYTYILYIIHSIKNSEMRKRITFPPTFKYTDRIHNVSRDNLEYYLSRTFFIKLLLLLLCSYTRYSNTYWIFTGTVSSLRKKNISHVCAIILIVRPRRTYIRARLRDFSLSNRTYGIHVIIYYLA